MRRLSILFAVMMGFALLTLFTGVVSAAEEVTVGFGSLRIGGIYQGAFTWYENDAQASQFTTKRARLLLFGTLIPDKVDYFVQADAVGSPYLLDTKLILKYIPKTSITLGRFVPNYSYYMPKSTAQLDLVNYPLATLRTAMWRQTGIESKSTFDNFELTLGVFNGFQTAAGTETLSGNDWGDNNDSKDFHVRVDFKPMKNVKIGAFGWFGSGYNSTEDEDFDVTRFGVNAVYTGKKVLLVGEYLMGSIDSAVGREKDYAGYFAHLGYSFTEKWETHLRYDSFDADTDVDDNTERWFTAGLNYKIHKYNAMFYLNYIARMEEGVEIDNDEIVLQFQYSF